jgi:hypothetical protein
MRSGPSKGELGMVGDVGGNEVHAPHLRVQADQAATVTTNSCPFPIAMISVPIRSETTAIRDLWAPDDFPIHTTRYS